MGYMNFLVEEHKLTSAKIYSVIVEPSTLILNKVCSTIGRCPTLTTCVVDEDRLVIEHSELGIFRVGTDTQMDYMKRKKAPLSTFAPPDLKTILYSAAWSDYVAPGAVAVDLTDDKILFKFPKVLLTVERTEAIIRVSSWDFGKEIFRPVPDHSRVRLYEAGTAATAFDWATLMNFGRTYTNLPGYNSLMTDVIRIAAFTPAAEKISTGTFTFEIWFPESIGSEDSFVVYTYLGVANPDCPSSPDCPTPVTA